MSEEADLLRAIVDRPDEAGQTWLVLAGWLDERGRSTEAELIRLQRQPTYRPNLRGNARQARVVKLLVGGMRPCVPTWTNDFGMEFVWVGPGTFVMGAKEGEEQRKADEGPLYQVTLTRGFWIGATPVTQAQWSAVGVENPSTFAGGDRPVDNLSWDDCAAFCATLSARDGRRYRMPTEAEWEFACRAGTTTTYFWGGTLPPTLANFHRPGGVGTTTAVKTYPPNAWGLYDVHGNIWEWIQDAYGPYPDGPVTDPSGPRSGELRVLRGGAWHVPAWYARSGYRAGNIPPGNRWNNYGMRLCLPAGPAGQARDLKS